MKVVRLNIWILVVSFFRRKAPLIIHTTISSIGWTIRFYVDETVPPSVIQQLEANGAEIVKVGDSQGSIAGMFWRFLVADDPTVDR